MWLHGVLRTRSALHLAATDQRVDDTVAGERRSLFLTGDDDEVYGKKLQCYAEDNRAAFNCTQR